METCYIYALVDPRTGEDFYVGSTIDPQARLNSHSNEKYANGPNMRRINEIKESGEHLAMRILEVVPLLDRAAREQIWIDRLRNEGCILTNIQLPMASLSLATNIQQKEEPVLDSHSFITLSKAAEFYPIAYSTLAQAAREGRLITYRSGKIWLTTRTAIERAIEEGKLRPRNERIHCGQENNPGKIR